MSTRSTLRWLDRDGNVVAQIYRHSDGYPSIVIPDLAEFFKWDTRANVPEYSAANFIYYMKMTMKELDEKIRAELGYKRPIETLEHLGYGIQNPNDGINDDVQYLYEIQYVYTPGKGKDVLDYIRIKVSKDMLRSGKLEWQFEGTLKEAIGHNWEED